MATERIKAEADSACPHCSYPVLAGQWIADEDEAHWNCHKWALRQTPTTA